MTRRHVRTRCRACGHKRALRAADGWCALCAEDADRARVECYVCGLPARSSADLDRNGWCKTCAGDLERADEDSRPGARCPHGRRGSDCDACDVASDLAFDSAREDRAFGRGR